MAPRTCPWCGEICSARGLACDPLSAVAALVVVGFGRTTPAPPTDPLRPLHWATNNLHRLRDVWYQVDESQAWIRSGPNVMAAVRDLAITRTPASGMSAGRDRLREPELPDARCPARDNHGIHRP